MRKHFTSAPLAIRIAICAAFLLALPSPAARAADEGDGRVQRRRGNPSPSADESDITTYTYQEEQINLGPDDQDILVLRTDEKVLLNRFVSATFPLASVHPREIRTVFRDLVGKEGGRAEVIRDKTTKENFLQVICPRWQLPFIREAVRVLDVEWLEEFNDGSLQTYYKAVNRPIDRVNAIAVLYAGEGFTELDEANNAATRLDEPYRLAEWVRAAKMADVPENQARFHVKVYEINVNNDLRLGLDYIAWKNGPGRNLFEFGLAGYDFDDRFRNVASFLTPLGTRDIDTGVHETHLNNASRFGYANYLVTAAYIDFLSSKGRAKVLAQGSIQVRSGSAGSFGATDEIVGFEVVPADTGDTGAEPVRLSDAGDFDRTGDLAIHNRRLERRANGEVGLFIDIFPVILTETMEVQISVELSEVEGLTPQGLPMIASTYNTTKARLRDGSTLVLAGMNRTEEGESKQGAPMLSRIPVLGYLFGGENNISREKQVVVVIEVESETGTESVLHESREYQDIRGMVEGDGAAGVPAVPKNRFGFDMWGLDGSSGGR